MFLSSEDEVCGRKDLVCMTMAGLKPALECCPMFNQIMSDRKKNTQMTGEGNRAMTTLDQSFSNIGLVLSTSDSSGMLLKMPVPQTFLWWT